jgi:uncharacterized protein
MIVRVPDLPINGLQVNFELDSKKLADRLNASSLPISERNIGLPSIHFKSQIPTTILLNSDGRTVEMKGEVKVDYVTQCARCTSEATEVLRIPIHVFVKPKTSNEDEEDIDFALYEGEDLDCSLVVEDLVVSKMPFSTYCDENCKGLCPSCGANLNNSLCSCENKLSEPLENFVGPFSKLKDLKFPN